MKIANIVFALEKIINTKNDHCLELGTNWKSFCLCTPIYCSQLHKDIKHDLFSKPPLSAPTTNTKQSSSNKNSSGAILCSLNNSKLWQNKSTIIPFDIGKHEMIFQYNIHYVITSKSKIRGLSMK